MPDFDNPVGRLHSMVSRLRAHQGKDRLYEHVAATLGIDANDPVTFYQEYSRLVELVEQAYTAASNVSSLRSDLYSEAFQQVRTAVRDFVPGTSWEHFRRNIGDQAVKDLLWVAQTVSNYGGDVHIEAEQLQRLRQEAEELRKSVLTAEINPILKAVLVGKLEEILHALDHYQLLGVEGLRRSFESGLGALVLNSPRADNAQGKALVRSVLEFIARAAGIIDFGLKAKELLQPVVNLLLPPGANPG